MTPSPHPSAPAPSAPAAPDAPELLPVEVQPAPALPGCDGEVDDPGTNGKVPDGELCDVWDDAPPVRADAAVALADLDRAYAEQFGQSLCITDGYRTYAQQVAAKVAKPTLTATPGKSNHGWGLAVDMCPDSYAGDRWEWLTENGPEYGWDNPQWARKGGGGPYEPWHWEFTDAVAATAHTS